MKRSSYLFACAVLSVLPFIKQTASAALTDYEGFNYTGTELTGQNGGTGWNGGWIATGTMPSNTLSNDDVSLTYPDYPSSGDRVSTGGLAANAGNTRLLSTPLDLSQEGNVRYASALFRKNAPNGGGVTGDNILLEFVTGDTGARRWGFGIAGNGDFPWLNHNGSTPATTAVVAGETYLIVTKVVSHASSPDEYFLKVFGPNFTTDIPASEPTTWDVQAAQGTDAVLDRIRIRIDAANGTTPGEVDEIRIATDWASVVAVPEPSSLALLGLGGLACLRRRRAAL